MPVAPHARPTSPHARPAPGIAPSAAPSLPAIHAYPIRISILTALAGYTQPNTCFRGIFLDFPIQRVKMEGALRGRSVLRPLPVTSHLQDSMLIAARPRTRSPEHSPPAALPARGHFGSCCSGEDSVVKPCLQMPKRCNVLLHRPKPVAPSLRLYIAESYAPCLSAM